MKDPAETSSLPQENECGEQQSPNTQIYSSGKPSLGELDAQVISGQGVAPLEGLSAKLAEVQALPSIEGLRSQMAAVQALPSLEGLRSQIASVQALPSLEGLRSQMATAQALPSMERLRSQMAAVQALPSLEGLRAQLDAVQVLPSLEGLRSQMAAAQALPSMERLRSQMATVQALPSLEGLRAQLDAVQVLPSLEGLRNQMAAVQALPSLERLSAQLAAVQALPSLEALRAQMPRVRLKDHKLFDTFENAVSTYQEVLNSSVLAKFIVSESGNRKLQSLIGIIQPHSSDFAEVEDRKDSNLSEKYIIGFLNNDDEPSRLPRLAYDYIRVYLNHIIRIAEIILMVVTLWQAYEFLEGKLRNTSTATEIRQVIQELPADQKMMLSSYRIIIRDRVILRAGPSREYAALVHLQLGAKAEVLDERGRWIKVSVELFGEDIEGWVYRSLTAPISKKKGIKDDASFLTKQP